ncbi:MAG TPA: xanthine dehydrogenase family protein molybdopterin-binding subunit [Thermodesulfobacteriota bacterium]|nr:xanthine dehydrogenase family protein molybdopterin-binding subunit [Thermodesulfobacteriota bacterium]
MGAWEKALGLTRFAADVMLENCAYLKVIRSIKDHALIKGIDTTKALAVPGVIAVFTARDIEGTNRFGPIIQDQPVLAENRVRYAGEALAVVAAESLQVAEHAASLVDVHYEDLEAVFDSTDAMGEESPKLHGSSNILSAMQIRKGDTREGFRRADVVVEHFYQTPFNEHGYLEPEAGVGWKDDNGRIVIRLSTQNPHENQAQVANTLGIPLEKIRIIQAPTGGAFGGKTNQPLPPIIALAVLKLSRPVRLVYSASESMVTTEKRHAFKMRLKTGATRDGKLTGIEAELVSNTGAYASYGKAVLERALIHATGPYEIPNVSVKGHCVYTNCVPAGAMRAFGAPQVVFAVESQIDILADKLGLDPFEFRRMNLMHNGSVTSTGQKLESSVGAEQTLLAIEPYYRQAIAWAGVAANETSGRNIKRGVGLATIFYGIGEAGFKNPSRIGIRITTDGWVELLVGAADMGQGVFSTLAQIAAETMGIPVNLFRVITPDTDITPDAGCSEASRQTLYSGNATQQAAASLKATLASVVSEKLENLPWHARLSALYTLCLEKGASVEHFGYFKPDIQPINREGQGKPHLAYAFASHMAQVEVDLDVGAVRVVKLVAAHDIGRAINPLTLEGQIEGGLMMALGSALKEEFKPGITRKWSHYKLPRTTDLPDIVNIIIEEQTPEGPFGAKGVGEVPAVGPAPAIINAVANACEVRTMKLPLTKDELKSELEASK